MTKHCMVDLETMSVAPNAVILTLGAVHFNPRSNTIDNELYIKFSIDDQDLLNRHIDPKTIDWWAKQNPKIIEEAFGDSERTPVKEAIKLFHKFAWGCDAFWSHGSVFDIVILENLYKQLEMATPWNYWQVRDTRTIFDIGYKHNMPQESKHNALEDAKRQAIGVQNVYAQLKY